METKLNKQLHGNFGSVRNRRGFFKNKRARKAYFWQSVGDATAYFLVFYFVGYLFGMGLVLYIFVWPFVKAIFGQ